MVTLWALRQNGLLMPWLIVAYALCTTLADHPDTQSMSLPLPKVQSQGQGCGSMANGLLTRDGMEIAFIWVLGHVSIRRDLAADSVAKDALSGNILDELIPFSDLKVLFKQICVKAFAVRVGQVPWKETASDTSKLKGLHLSLDQQKRIIIIIIIINNSYIKCCSQTRVKLTVLYKYLLWQKPL